MNSLPSDADAPLGAFPGVDPADPDLREGLARARETGYNPLPVEALQVETSSICNFRCASCALSLGDYDRPSKHMTATEFQRILDAFPTVKKVELQGVGEVFLNDDVFAIIRSAVDRGVAVHTFSNASKISRSTAEAILDSGLSLINFSMDGADEPTFRKLRKGGTLARYRRCVSNLVEARAARRARGEDVNLTIGAMSVISKANKAQLPQLIAIAESLGVDTIILTKINVGPKPDQEPLLLSAEDHAEIDALPEYDGRIEVVRATRPWTKAERMGCYWPQGMAYVTVEGDVTPCCNYFDSRDLKLGNAFESPGDEIWNGEPYRAFRRRLLGGDLPHHCQVC